MMADIIDRAGEREEADRVAAIAAARRLDPNRPKPCGLCHNCGHAIAAGLLCCDDDCTADWRYRLARGRS